MDLLAQHKIVTVRVGHSSIHLRCQSLQKMNQITVGFVTVRVFGTVAIGIKLIDYP